MNKETFDRGSIRRYSSDNLFQALREAEVFVKILGEYIPEKEEENTKMNEKKIVFISQTMRGLSDEDILAAREEAIQDIYNILAEKGIEKECIEIADSYFDDYNATKLLENVTNIPLVYRGESLKFLAKSHYAYFCDGWEEARGCKMEHLCAAEYGVEIIKD